MMTYEYPSNFSNGTIVENLGTFIQYANYAAGGWLAYAFLMLIFIMSFVVGLATSSRKALLSSSFITFVFSVYFLRLNLISPIIVFLFIVLIIVGALGSKSEGQI